MPSGLVLAEDDGDVDVAAGLDEGQQLVVQIAGGAAEVVVGIGGDHGVEEVVVEGQGGGVGLDGDQAVPGDAHDVEEGLVLRRVAPQVGGVDGEAVLLGQKDAGQALAAAQVADHAPGGDAVVQKKLLLQLDGVGPHDFGAEGGGVVGFAFGIAHVYSPFLRGAQGPGDGGVWKCAAFRGRR